MFKPAHIMQALMLLAAAGCASSPPASSIAPTNRPDLQPPTATHGARTPNHTPSPLPSAQATVVGPASAPAGQQQTAIDNSSSEAARTIPASKGSFVDDSGQLQTAVLTFAHQVAQQHDLPVSHAIALLSEAQYNERVARLMAPPKTRIRKSWVTYRQRFVEPIRIDAGVQFWNNHYAILESVSQHYGVPASIIVAIIGVETIYGRYMGDFRVLDSLATLAFRYPDPKRTDRVQLFRDQLADLIALDYKGQLDAQTLTGSYAGALGLPQFMPGSLMRYAADGDGDGHIDLENNPADAIASVANFLRMHGWLPGLPVFAPVDPGNQAAALVDGGLEPRLSWSQIVANGAHEHTPVGKQNWKEQKLGIVDLIDEPRNLAEYRVGTPNFYAITQYNRSYFYATSVAELAEALKQRINRN